MKLQESLKTMELKARLAWSFIIVALIQFSFPSITHAEGPYYADCFNSKEGSRNLLEWTPDPLKDKTIQFYQDLPNLAQRVERTDVFKSTIPMVMGCLNYDRQDGGEKMNNDLRIGPTIFDDRSIFEAWNQMDYMIGFFNSYISDKDQDVASVNVPTPQMIRIGHKNGVKVLGNIFFDGNRSGDISKFNDPKNIDKFISQLVLLARTFHFDGWFYNNEAGINDADVKKVVDGLRKEGLFVVYYSGFLNDLKGRSKIEIEISKSGFFSDYSWDNNDLNNNVSVVPLDKQKYIFMASQWHNEHWGLEQTKRIFNFNLEHKKQISSGYFCVEEPFGGYGWDDVSTKAKAIKLNQTFVSKWFATTLPTKNITKSYADSVKNGVGNLLTPKTVITQLPFETCFNLGRGISKFEKGVGKATSTAGMIGWGNADEQDILPNYVIQLDKKSGIWVDFDFNKAWSGGTSLHLVNNGALNDVPVYLSACNNLKAIDINIIFQVKDPKATPPNFYIKDKNSKIIEIPLSVSKAKAQGKGWYLLTDNHVNISSIYEFGVVMPPKSDLHIGSIVLSNHFDK